MLNTVHPITRPRAFRWSMTSEMLDALENDSYRLANEADRNGGYITGFFEGEPDAPTLVPNVTGQRLVHQLTSIRRAMSTADVVLDQQVAVIGRRITLEEADGHRTTCTLVIPDEGDPAHGWVSVNSPVGEAVYLKRVGDAVSVQAPSGHWSARLVRVE